jgi:hypothetical protein
VADSRFRIPSPRVQVLLLVGAVILLGAVAWGIGRAIRGLSDSQSLSPPAATSEPPVMSAPSMTHTKQPAPSPTASPPPSATPTALPTASSTEQPTPTPIPSTSTPALTSTPTPTPAFRTYLVKQGDSLAIIAGKMCPRLISYEERMDFAREIQGHNPDKIPNVDVVYPGTELLIPPCPK